MRLTGRRLVVFTCLLLVATGCARGGSPSLTASPANSGPLTDAVAQRFETLRSDPGMLQLFLHEMPKGGDIHSHLSGAIYAESYIAWAAEDGLCLARATMALVPPPCDAPAGRPMATTIPGDPDLYTDVIDAWSLRNWNPSQESGHRRFFSTFGRFGLATRGRTGDMLAEVSARAASQQVSYLELMHTADGGVSGALGRRVGWTEDLALMRERLLAAGLQDSIAVARRALDAAETRQRELLRCGSAAADPGCGVTVRYLYQVARGRPLEEVFGQILMGFELTRADPRVVGLNLVQPEDHPVPMGDYQRHMAIIGWLHTVYPGVRVTLHAGELAEGLVPPEGLRFHIREAVEVARAERIGHGVAVMHEADALGLLSLMAERRVLVEIALSSNDIILGVRGARHPLRTYLRHGVPVTLVTDDEGVARSSLTQEYRRAVQEHEVDYRTLRQMARNSISYAFVEEPEKGRLLDQLDAAFARFEARWARP